MATDADVLFAKCTVGTMLPVSAAKTLIDHKSVDRTGQD